MADDWSSYWTPCSDSWEGWHEEIANTSCDNSFIEPVKPLHIDEEKAIAQTIQISVRDQKESPFLKLPGELRNMVYEYLFTMDGLPHYRGACREKEPPDIEIYDWYGRTEEGLSFVALKRRPYGLLWTCRQLRHEGAPLLLSEVGLPYTCEKLHAFFENFSPRELSCITSLDVELSFGDFRIDYDNYSGGTFWTWEKFHVAPYVFKNCTELKEITIYWNASEQDRDLDFEVMSTVVDDTFRTFRTDKHDPNMVISWIWDWDSE